VPTSFGLHLTDVDPTLVSIGLEIELPSPRELSFTNLSISDFSKMILDSCCHPVDVI